MVLDTEVEAFRERHEELLREYRTGFALFIGRELLGVFDSRDDAEAEGYRQRGNVPMLIKRIEEQPRAATVPYVQKARAGASVNVKPG